MAADLLQSYDQLEIKIYNYTMACNSKSNSNCQNGVNRIGFMSMLEQINWNEYDPGWPLQIQCGWGDMRTDTQTDGADYGKTIWSDWAEGR